MAVRTPLILNSGQIEQLQPGDTIGNNISLQAYQALGGVIKAEPINFDVSKLTSALNLANQTLRLVAVWLPQAATITGVKWYQTTQGSYAANNYNGVGLYTYSGGVITLVASSTDDGNIWKATINTLASKAFSSTYAAQAGLYFIGALYCTSAQTTAPGVVGIASLQGSALSALDFTNSAKISGSIGSSTALPTPQNMSGVVASSLQFYFALY